jgi:hypothetical protein
MLAKQASTGSPETVGLLPQLKPLAQTIELAKGQLQMIHPFPDNARMEIRSNLIAVEARLRHQIAKADLEGRQAGRQAAFEEARKAHGRRANQVRPVTRRRAVEPPFRSASISRFSQD